MVAHLQLGPSWVGRMGSQTTVRTFVTSRTTKFDGQYVDRHIWAWPCLNNEREMERFRDKELHNGDEMIGIWHARVSCCRTKHPVACRRLLLVLTSQRGCMGNRLTVWQDYNSSWRKTYKTRRAHWTWFPSLEYQSPNCFLTRSQLRSVKHQSFSSGTYQCTA